MYVHPTRVHVLQIACIMRTYTFMQLFHYCFPTGNIAALNSKAQGTKFGVHYELVVPANSHVTIKCRLVAEGEAHPLGFETDFDAVFQRRISETNDFYKQVFKNVPLYYLVPEKF